MTLLSFDLRTYHNNSAFRWVKIEFKKQLNFKVMTNKDTLNVCFFFLLFPRIFFCRQKGKRAKKGRQNSNKLIKCGAFSGVCNAFQCSYFILCIIDMQNFCNLSTLTYAQTYMHIRCKQTCWRFMTIKAHKKFTAFN